MVPLKGLKNRAMLAIHGEYPYPALFGESHDYFTGDHQGFFVSQASPCLLRCCERR